MKYFLLLLIPVCALAGETVVETPGPSILYRADGTSQNFKTYAECLRAAPVAAAPGAASRCSTVTNITKTGVCDAAEPPSLDDENGVVTQCPNDANRWYLRIDGWKRSPWSTTAESCTWKIVKIPEDPPPLCTGVLASAWTRDDPETIAEDPVVDPDFNEFDPEGPQPGPPGAPPVDKPDTITARAGEQE